MTVNVTCEFRDEPIVIPYSRQYTSKCRFCDKDDCTHRIRTPDQRGELNSQYKGYRMKNGYKLIRMPDHPFADKAGYYPEHRLVYEQVNGRYLQPHEQIHHFNGKKLDNQPGNLFPTTYHSRLHGQFKRYEIDIHIDIPLEIIAGMTAALNKKIEAEYDDTQRNYYESIAESDDLEEINQYPTIRIEIITE